MYGTDYYDAGWCMDSVMDASFSDTGKIIKISNTDWWYCKPA